MSMKEFTDTLAAIRRDQKKLAEVEAMGPSAEETLDFFKQEVAAGKERYVRYLRSRIQREKFYTDVGDNTHRNAFDRDCFFFPDAMIGQMTEWQRGEPAGLSPAERIKVVTTLRPAIEAGWVKLCRVCEKLQADGQVFDWPGDLPAAIFLQWNEKEKTIGKHSLFVQLHALSERQHALNSELQTTLLRIENEEKTFAEHVRLMRGNSLTPPKQLQDTEHLLERCKEMRRAAQTKRDTERRAVAGSLALYAACKQFLHHHGVTLSPQFLLLGQELTVEPFIEPGPPRVTPLATHVRVV
jgi:hypothetical protein